MKSIEEKNVPAQALSTFGVGVGARHVVRAQKTDALVNAILQAVHHNTPFQVIGGGSNIIFPDVWVEKLIIVNEAKEISQDKTIITISSGTPLADFITYAIQNNLGGIESLSGIPGTVGGAIVGNAGAYGQSISDTLVSVVVHDGITLKTLSKNECLFSYRESIFKTEPLYIISAQFRLVQAESKTLAHTSEEIIALREKKYPPNLKCPGSFFKNIIADTLPKELLQKMDVSKIKGGKIPAGYLLEATGACGKKYGGISVADYHGNLIVNSTSGTVGDTHALVNDLQKEVFNKFGITLEYEVRFVQP
jgi:UDP-N-acetylmuramate dehydrogenase